MPGLSSNSIQKLGERTKFVSIWLISDILSSGIDAMADRVS